MINKYVINSLLCDDDLWNLRVIGKDNDLDIIALDFKNLQFDRNVLINLIKSDSAILAPTIGIDALLLSDDNIISALREKRKDNIMRIRIVNDNYILTEDDYNKLSFVDYIYVDRVDDFNYSLFKVFLQKGIYKHQFEKVISEDKDEYRDVFHVDHRLNGTELRKLVMDANNSISAEIDLNLYDPSYYYEFVKTLNDLELRKDINVTLLSNVLVDSKNLFEELSEFRNNINIIYSSNHEVVNYMTHEPMNNMVNYDNQLEINDHSTLTNYINLLELIDGGTDYIKDKAFSPLESLIWTYKYIRECDLDIDSSNLFSAMLRRAGESVYRYSSLGENKNILRIKDTKYKVDNIGIVDFNIDMDEYKFRDDNNYLYFPNLGSEHCNFIYSPRDMLKCYGYDETLSISNSLVLDKETYNKLKYKSSDNLEIFYNINYDNRGNTFRFLELVGLKDDDDYSVEDLYKIINNINEYGLTSNIDDDTMFEALINVEKSINPSIDENEINRIKSSYKKANDIRDNNIFVRDYHVISNYEILDNGELVYDEKEELVTPIEAKNIVQNIEEERVDNMISVVEDVETSDDYISGTNIKRPRKIREGESPRDYNVYYRQYFNKYLLPIINSNKDTKDKEEEFIVSPEVKEESRIITKAIYDKYFGKNKEDTKETIEDNKDVINYESYDENIVDDPVSDVKPKKRSPYGDIDEKYLNIIESIDKVIFKGQTKRINNY